MLVAGAPADKPARLVPRPKPWSCRAPAPASSAGVATSWPPLSTASRSTSSARRALDAGASTGGFTDCLLQRGAAQVIAVDVGYGQLDARLRADPRVAVLERTNVRTLTPESLAGAVSAPDDADGWDPVDVVTADLSFISLRRGGTGLAGPIARPGADLVVLVKPQFEAGRAEVSRGKGVVRDPDTWRRSLESAASALGDAGAAIMGAMRSPVIGPAGNTEFLLHAVAGRGPARPVEVEPLIAAAVDEARSRQAEAVDQPVPDAATGPARPTGRTG